MLSLRSLLATAKEVVAQPSNQEVVLAEAVVEAEGPMVVQEESAVGDVTPGYP